MIKRKRNLQKIALIMKAKGKKNILSTIRNRIVQKIS